ncbi:MAG: RNA-binding S4 domain-containing protein, partial [Bacteroidota bacterium]|nr:RNA-binding S4 domain-containing protein [Bacteroidota bacterium]
MNNFLVLGSINFFAAKVQKQHYLLFAFTESLINLYMPEKEKLRIDKYLWAIRIFKTRSVSTDACNNGKIKYLGINVKASKPVNIGEQYEVKTEAKKWVIQVAGLLHNRVQFSEATKYYIDLTPEESMEKAQS